MKIGFVSSIGGHFNQLLALNEIYEKYVSFFVTFSGNEQKSVKNLSIANNLYLIKNPHRSLKDFFICSYQSLKIMIKERPSLVITTGSGIALPMCILSKLFANKVIFIESFSRITRSSNFGKLAYPIADLTIVQWKSLLKHYPEARYGGPIFNLKSNNSTEQSVIKNRIFVTVGARYESFDRPIMEIDKLVGKGLIGKEVIAQIGNTEYEPKNFEFFRFCSREKFDKYIATSKLIITADGAGTISSCIYYMKPTIVIPRRFDLGEILIQNEDISVEFDRMNLVKTVLEIEGLYAAIQNAKPPELGTLSIERKIPAIIENQIGQWFKNHPTQI